MECKMKALFSVATALMFVLIVLVTNGCSSKSLTPDNLIPTVSTTLSFPTVTVTPAHAAPTPV